MQKVAIYSRKSKFTGKGDSIENQIEMCKDYVRNHLKNDCEFIVYEDEGFSGGTVNRPMFKKLMQDIKFKKIDVLVCYKLDRISRNVADFSTTLEILESNKVDFISISEQFDTSTPMGRAMIYIASVFAQLERETIAERVRDNMIEIAKNGKWTGGKIPYGFTSEKSKYIDESGCERENVTLKKNGKEMDFVIFLYNKYLELGSLHKLECYIAENNLKTRNNVLFEKSSLKLILQNPVYVKANVQVIEYLKSSKWKVYGEVDNQHSLLTYNKTEQSIKDGKHVKINKALEERFAAVSNIDGVIEPKLWLQVQNQFMENKDKFPRLGKTHNALLTGKLKCGLCGEYMLIQHGKVSKITGEKLFYYMCSLKRKSHKKACSNSNAKAADIENLVLLSLKNLAKSKKDFIDNLKAYYNSKKNNSEVSDEKITLNKSLSEKNKQIENLITQLSNCSSIEDLLINRIKTLKDECFEIETRLANLDVMTKELKTNTINLEIIESLLSQCEVIDKLPREVQKNIISVLIDTIYWYGNNDGKGKITIKFIGTEDSNNSHEVILDESKLLFGSPSMCNVNNSATFKNIFKDIESSSLITYAELSEETIGDKIYKLRKVKGYNRHQFADICNIGYSSLCKYETGISYPDNKNINKICAALGLPVKSLER